MKILFSDYPSLGHIAHVARENNVNIIWAVTSAHINLYSRLTEVVSASVAGMISDDSSNVVELIQVHFEQLWWVFTGHCSNEGII